ncbi:MarR family winged helix-turn-helix transcriptional regulator [Pseudogemmobacter sp. W21_MBD1_M6]|uniref:MarR family winged helix-turn-helix transcriptional regulator n=1 Tax=Pseudogemmobacter sp. W21_MBD1_M6 TaxID=3240271 RepID=UPI003F9E864A
MKLPKAAQPDTQTPLSDSNLRQFAGYSLKRAYLVADADMRRMVATLGLRQTTFSALATIIENPDITQTQLGQALFIERSGVVLIVDELENAELITRNKVKNDRRSYALRVTLKGRRLWEKARAQVLAQEDRTFSALSANERAAFVDMLNRIEATQPDDDPN